LSEKKGTQMNDGSEQSLILEIGAAGGTLSVWSVNAMDGIRSFLVKQDESTLMEFLDEEEDASNLNYNSETGELCSFDDALDILGRYPWHRLSPIFAHQDFIDPILKAVEKRGGAAEANRWRAKLKKSKI